MYANKTGLPSRRLSVEEEAIVRDWTRLNPVQWAGVLPLLRTVLSWSLTVRYKWSPAAPAMSDALGRVGLFVDQHNEVRLLEPSIYQKCVQLRDLSDQFMASKCLLSCVCPLTVDFHFVD